jgi:hypothetical protein
MPREWALTDEQRAQIEALPPSNGQKSRPLRYPGQMVEGAIYRCAAASQWAGSSAAGKGNEKGMERLTASR